MISWGYHLLGVEKVGGPETMLLWFRCWQEFVSMPFYGSEAVLDLTAANAHGHKSEALRTGQLERACSGEYFRVVLNSGLGLSLVFECR